jgi:hypothetical protein
VLCAWNSYQGGRDGAMQAIVVNSWVKVRGLSNGLLNSLLTPTKSYDDMRVSQVAIPRPQSDELLIHIKASGLNFADLLYVREQLSYSYLIVFMI